MSIDHLMLSDKGLESIMSPALDSLKVGKSEAPHLELNQSRGMVTDFLILGVDNLIGRKAYSYSIVLIFCSAVR
jgi:hypothetical protein